MLDGWVATQLVKLDEQLAILRPIRWQKLYDMDIIIVKKGFYRMPWFLILIEFWITQHLSKESIAITNILYSGVILPLTKRGIEVKKDI